MRFKARLARPEDLKEKGVWRDITDSWDNLPFVEESEVDAENKLIKNVCIFGTRYSKNGYTYQDQAIDTLSKLAHGAKAFINHPSKSEEKDRDGVRDLRDWMGVFSNPHREGEKIFCDLMVRESCWDLVKDIAVMRPAGIGNSINSRVKVFKDDNGKEHIADIDSLRSVDLVASAATVSNLWESFPETSEEETIKEEGILKDKIQQGKISRAINDIQYQAMEVIDEIMRRKEGTFADKRKDIDSLLNDLGDEIENIMTGKTKLDSTSGRLSLDSQNSNQKDTEDEMDLSKLTLEELKKGRDDLIKAIMSEINDSEKMGKLEAQVVSLSAKVEKLTSEFDYVCQVGDELKKENADLRKKVDEYEQKEKKTAKEGLIKTKLEAAKLPTEAVTDIFMTDLMGKDEAGIDASIEDRKNIWNVREKVVKNVGGERKVNFQEGEKDSDPEKKKEVTEKFVSAFQN